MDYEGIPTYRLTRYEGIPKVNVSSIISSEDTFLHVFDDNLRGGPKGGVRGVQVIISISTLF